MEKPNLFFQDILRQKYHPVLCTSAGVVPQNTLGRYFKNRGDDRMHTATYVI